MAWQLNNGGCYLAMITVYALFWQSVGLTAPGYVKIHSYDQKMVRVAERHGGLSGHQV